MLTAAPGLAGWRAGGWLAGRRTEPPPDPENVVGGGEDVGVCEEVEC